MDNPLMAVHLELLYTLFATKLAGTSYIKTTGISGPFDHFALKPEQHLLYNYKAVFIKCCCLTQQSSCMSHLQALE